MSKVATLEELRDQIEVVRNEMADLDAAIQSAGVDIEEESLSALDEKFNAKEAELKMLTSAADRADRINKAIAAVPGREDGKAAAGTLGRVTSEPLVYRKRGPNGFFKDIWYASRGNPGAQERLQRHERQVQIERPEYYQEVRDISIGGAADFIPPIYLAEEWAELARAGRPLADAIGPRPMPDSGDTFTVPKISGGTGVGMQATEADAATETNATKTSVTFGVKTAAGQQDLSLQLFERSSPGFDEVIAEDLAAAYATNVDNQVINGSDASGQVEGLLLADSINAVTYTDATPTAGEVYAKIADGIQRIHAARFLPPNLIAMAPRRWGFFLAERDTTGRPLIVEGPQGPTNAMAQFPGVASEAMVGTMQGLPVLADGSIPTNRGAGTNEDVIFVLRTRDLLLFESPVRARVLPEVLSGTLQVRLQVYGYIAFTAERFPQSVSYISGTGLVTPTFV